MGKVGTDVAKEAADVILTDDNFATIESAVEEGRRIYDNILKVIQFLLSSNVGEVILLFLAVMLTPAFGNWFGIEDVSSITPLLAIHILWVNLVTDSLPALALAVDPPNHNIMDRPPRKNSKGIFTGGMVYRIIYQGLMIGLLTLAAFVIRSCWDRAVYQIVKEFQLHKLWRLSYLHFQNLCMCLMLEIMESQYSKLEF